jgi:hypothetical protein
MRILIGCERSGVVRRAFRAAGHDAWSCDLVPAADGDRHHLQCDVLSVLDDGWDMALFHPDCTFFTNSAAWAFRDPDYDRWPGIGYHQKIRPGTLTGAARRAARDRDAAFVVRLVNCPIPRIAIENPHGWLARLLGPASQVVQPNQFGDDASRPPACGCTTCRHCGRPRQWRRDGSTAGRAGPTRPTAGRTGCHPRTHGQWTVPPPTPASPTRW